MVVRILTCVFCRPRSCGPSHLPLRACACVGVRSLSLCVCDFCCAHLVSIVCFGASKYGSCGFPTVSALGLQAE